MLHSETILDNAISIINANTNIPINGPTSTCMAVVNTHVNLLTITIIGAEHPK